MTILDYGVGLRNAPNPVAGGMQAAGQMQGLMQSNQLFEQQQQDRQQEQDANQQAQVKRQAAIQEGADILMADDYNAKAQFMFNNPDVAQQFKGAMKFKDETAETERIDFNKKILSSSGDPRPAIIERIARVESMGGDTENLRGNLNLASDEEIRGAFKDELSFLDAESMIKSQEALGVDGANKSLPAESTAFNDLIKDFSPEQQKNAKLIKAGLKGRAMSNAVLSAIESGQVSSLADAKAMIGEAEKFASATGASRAKIIDKNFEKIQKISVGLGNIDRALEAVDAGAGVGAIEKRFPSLKAASIALDAIQGEMALDVIGSTTFGALSEGELNLAKSIALPTGLDSKDLRRHLVDKKAAQEKLRDYYQEQIQFIDQGGTVAGFLRMKGRMKPSQSGQPATQEVQVTEQIQGPTQTEGETKTVNWSDL
jgi:hypothetical protein